MKKGLFVFTNSPFWTDTIKKLSLKGYKPSLIIGSQEHKKHFKDSLVLDPHSFRIANSKNFLKVKDVCDKNIIEHLNESILSSQICLTRFLPSKVDISTDQRNLFINRSINFIFSMLDNFKFDFIVLASPPHRVIDQLLVDVGKIKKIPTLIFHHTMFDKYHYISGNPNIIFNKEKQNEKKDLSKFLKLAIDKISKGETFNYTLSAASPKFKVKIKKKSIVKNLIKKVTFLKKKNMMYSLGPLKSGNDVHFTGYFKFKANHLLNKYKVSLAKKYYDKTSVSLDKEKKYLYYPISYQPESSLCPTGGFFSHNLISLMYLNSVIPDNYEIFCKIHPRQFSKPVDRDNTFDKAYIKSLNEYSKRIKFLKKDTNNLKIIKNSEGIIVDTNASTSFIEAMCLSKKVLSLNKDAYFRYFSNVLDLRKKNLSKVIVDQFLNTSFNNNKFLENLNEFEAKTFDFSLYLLSQQETRNMIEFEYKQENNDYERINNLFVDEIIRNVELEKND